jgi:hypothetical protein
VLCLAATIAGLFFVMHPHHRAAHS